MTYVFVAGIIYFGTETAKIVELHKFLTAGKGRYKPKDDDFVVVTGAGVDGSENFLIPGFVNEMYHDDHMMSDRPLPLSLRWPMWFRQFWGKLTQRQGFREVVFLVEDNPNNKHELDDDYRDWVMQNVETQKRANIYFFEGQIEERGDCDRICLTHAYMCFIIPDAQAAREFSREQKFDHDLGNIMKAMMVRKNAESVKLRLCLLSSTKITATSFGLDPLNVLSLGEVTAAMTACSVRVWGCIPFLSGILWTLHDAEIEDLKMHNCGDPVLYSIMNEYVEGCGYQVYGLKLHRVYTGKRLRDVTRATFMKHGILIIGAQEQGALKLNPDIVVSRHLVVFVLAEDSTQIKVLQATQGQPWDDEFVYNRRNAKMALEFGAGVSAADQDRLIMKKMTDGVVKVSALAEMDVGQMIQNRKNQSNNNAALAFMEEATTKRGPQSAGLSQQRSMRADTDTDVIREFGNMAEEEKDVPTQFAFMAQEGMMIPEQLSPAHRSTVASTASTSDSESDGDEARTQTYSDDHVQQNNDEVFRGVQEVAAMASSASQAPSDDSAADVPDVPTPTLNVFTVVIGDQSWQECIFTLGRIQKDTIGRKLRLTVVAENIPKKAEEVLLRMGCFVYIGRLSNGPKLIQSGLLDADVIIVSNGTMADAEVLSKLCTIKKLQIHAASDHAFVLCELKNGLQSLDVYTYVTRYHYMTRATGKKILAEPVGKHFIKGDDDFIKDLGESLASHESFLAGGTILADIFGYVMARMIYLPATIELFTAILQPSDAQPNVLSQVKVPPKWVGKTWGELAKWWVGCAESVLPVGLYRTREIVLSNGDSTDVRFFVTMPEGSTKLVADDFITVIASRDWVAMMSRKGLVRCGRTVAKAAGNRKRGNIDTAFMAWQEEPRAL